MITRETKIKDNLPFIDCVLPCTVASMYWYIVTVPLYCVIAPITTSLELLKLMTLVPIVGGMVASWPLDLVLKISLLLNLFGAWRLISVLDTGGGIGIGFESARLIFASNELYCTWSWSNSPPDRAYAHSSIYWNTFTNISRVKKTNILLHISSRNYWFDIRRPQASTDKCSFSRCTTRLPMLNLHCVDSWDHVNSIFF